LGICISARWARVSPMAHSFDDVSPLRAWAVCGYFPSRSGANLSSHYSGSFWVLSRSGANLSSHYSGTVWDVACCSLGPSVTYGPLLRQELTPADFAILSTGKCEVLLSCSLKLLTQCGRETRLRQWHDFVKAPRPRVIASVRRATTVVLLFMG
jgi:hypothetical protein